VRVGDEWVVRQGLSKGDRVVVDGTQKLEPGILVQTQPVGASDIAVGVTGPLRNGS
jgi:membrane fusion protein (multidrug efflux system)